MKFLSSLLLVSLCILASCQNSSQKEQSNSTQSSTLYAEAIIKNTSPSNPHLYVTAGSGLSLRQGTNLKSKKILTIPYGSQIEHLSSPEHTSMTVAGITGDMIHVAYQGVKGFVFSGYLSTLAPPLEEESAEQYAKRLSTPEHTIAVTKTKNPKGDAFGLTTSIELPANSWGETYLLGQALFDIPKSIAVDLTNNSKTTVSNPNKRTKTKIDEVVIARDDKNQINAITYSYALRDYNRTVIITKNDSYYLITETEVSK